MTASTQLQRILNRYNFANCCNAGRNYYRGRTFSIGLHGLKQFVAVAEGRCRSYRSSVCVCVSEIDMGWVNSWAELSWVEYDFYHCLRLS